MQWSNALAIGVLLALAAGANADEPTCEGQIGAYDLGAIEWGGHGETPVDVTIGYALDEEDTGFRPRAFIRIDVGNVRGAFAAMIDSLLPDDTCGAIFTNHHDTRLEIVLADPDDPATRRFRVGGSVNLRARACPSYPCGLTGRFPDIRIRTCRATVTLFTKTLNFNMFFLPIYQYDAPNRQLRTGMIASAELELTPEVEMFRYHYDLSFARRFLVPMEMLTEQGSGLPVGMAILDFSELFQPEDLPRLATDGEGLGMEFGVVARNRMRRDLACQLFDRFTLETGTAPPQAIP